MSEKIEKKEFFDFLTELAFLFDYSLSEKKKEKWWKEFKGYGFKVFKEACEKYKTQETMNFPKPIQVKKIVEDIIRKRKEEFIIAELNKAPGDCELCEGYGVVIETVKEKNGYTHQVVKRCICKAGEKWSPKIPKLEVPF